MKIPGYKVLILLRFLLTLNLQNGYIHPDEFFQSIEVVAGDVLDTDVYRPWEFSGGAKPIRSITVPYVTVGLPLLVLRTTSRLIERLFDVSLVTPYLVLVVPRLVAMLLSVVADYQLVQLCRLVKRSPRHCLFIYTSSYVAMVYLTRTLSNSIELLLFAVLLRTVSRFVHDAERLLVRHTKLRRKGDCIGDPAANLGSLSANWVAILLVVGTFNRPTFLAFAVAPLAFWLLYGCTTPLWGPRDWRNLANNVARRAILLLPVVTFTVSALVVCDTLYYRGVTGVDLSVSKLYDPEFIISLDWVVAPWNFVRYNADPSNLALHGLHSHLTHLLVNVPLLFGILGAVAMVHYCKTVRLAFSKRRMPSASSSIDLLALFCLVVPVILLSFAPHQEPRFLLPLLVPLVFLHGERLTASHSSLSQAFKVIWIAGNFAGFVFYGLLHQGGVVPSLAYLHKLHTTGAIGHTDVVFYHTYMPPRFLLLQPRSNDAVTISKVDNGLQVHDLMCQPLSTLLAEIQRLTLAGPSGTSVVLLSPASLRKEIEAGLASYVMYLNKTFPLHLSLEDPPGLGLNFFGNLGLDLHTIDTQKIAENKISKFSRFELVD